ncbi:MAG: GNAT family N-acetyltransferase, partial [Aestuariivirga sp.]
MIPAVQPRATDETLTLAVHTALAPVEALWTAFEAHAHTTLYQTFLWCRAWSETVGKAQGIEIRIVTAANKSGETAFILPLQIGRRSGIRVLEWLGSPHATYGHGLFAPAFLGLSRNWFARNWAEIVRLAGPVDAIHLTGMPEALGGVPHPLQPLFNLRGPNRSYRMALPADYDLLLAAKRSAETRRRYRKRERALAALGDLQFGLPKGREETHATLALMFEQQEKRLGERGVHGVFGPVEREFLHRLADLQDEAKPVLLPYT